MAEAASLDRLMIELRPRLHRYCARMVGSAVDGEDVLQEALAKAAEAYSAAVERPESWLFRVAHNTALDALRRRKRQVRAGSGVDLGRLADPGAAADARVAAAASLAAFMRLPAAQRSSVILMDVLGYSLAETVEILGVSLAAVKAALHRARGRLSAIANDPDDRPPSLAAAEQDRLRAYADRFNARDFDALRELLAEDVRLDLVSRTKLAGARDVSQYFIRYDSITDWRFEAGMADGRPALLGREPSDASGAVAWVVFLDWTDGRITGIRDFKFAPYVMASLSIGPL
jgi:RNA polymerase sigma-70 factor (ECF subfamily)